MKGLATKVIQMMLVLIAMYLVLVNWKGATAVLRAAGANTTSLAKTLQGR